MVLMVVSKDARGNFVVTLIWLAFPAVAESFQIYRHHLYLDTIKRSGGSLDVHS